MDARRAMTLALAGALLGAATACSDSSAPTAETELPAGPGASPLGPDVPSAAAAPASAPKNLAPARSELMEDRKYPAPAHPEIDTLHHSLDLTWKDGRLVGKDTITFRATEDTQQVQLSLRGSLQVARATLDGRPVKRSHDADLLTIVGPGLTKDSQHLLVLEYAGTPSPVPAPSARGDMADGLGWMTKKGEVTSLAEPYGAMSWLPCNDYAGDKALYDLRLTTGPKELAVTGGSLTGRTRDETSTVTTWRLDVPTPPYLLPLAIADYRYRAVPLAGGKTFNLWYRLEDAPDVPGWETMAQESYAWLVERLGPYPFTEIGAVAVAQDTAMETTTMVTMGQASFGAQGKSVLQHELAHQWYGDSVTPKDWQDLWLNEGWAMFLQMQYLQDRGSLEASGFRSAAESCPREVWYDGQAGDYKRDQFGGGAVYMCGAALLDELKAELGDEKFWQMARAWEDRFAGRNASRTDFENFLQERYGKDYRPLTRKWLDEVTPG